MKQRLFRSRKSDGSRSWLRALTVFLSSAAVLGLVQTPGRFPDADAFYHAKIALLSLSGPVRDFSWLPFTVLSSNFADHHFLLHLIMAPFVYWGGSVWGLKIVMIILGAAAITSFYLLLRRLNVNHAWFFVFLLATSGPVMERLSLVKATGLSLILVFAALWAIRFDRRRALFFLSALFVWSYGGWPILGLIGFLDITSVTIGSRWKHDESSEVTDHLSQVRAALFRLLLICAGLAFGLLVSPFFPGNLIFYWEQIMQVAVIGHSASVVPGVEWLPFTPLDIFCNISPIIIAWAVLGLFYLITVFWPETRKSAKSSSEEHRFVILSWLLMFAALGMTLMSRRHIEYLVPVSLLALAVSSSALFGKVNYRNFKFVTQRLFFRRGIVLAFVVLLGGFFVFMAIRSVKANLEIQRAGYPPRYLSSIGEYLNQEVPPGEVVFNVAWEDFPALFLFSERHYFISGLDPNFLARADVDLYRTYSDLACGRTAEDSSSVIRRDFKSSYAVIPAGHPLRPWFSGDGGARLLYADDGEELWYLGDKLMD